MKTRLLFRAALMIALLTVGARIQIPLPYFDYYTLQFTFVLLAAVILPPRYAWGSVATYVVMGLIGIPIFAGAVVSVTLYAQASATSLASSLQPVCWLN